MDQKSWLWKKRSAEKTLAANKANHSCTNNEEDEEAEVLELSAALSDCSSSKDDAAKKQAKIAQEAIAGWEKAKREAISLKKDLDKILQQKAVSEERLSHLDAALKECMQELRFAREEQEKRVHGAVIKSSEEFEKTHMALNEKLVEAGNRIAKLDAENTQFRKALSGKDKVIEELSKYRTQVEADLNALMLRVESTEKENASLKYEVRVLEKELEIRNEETEVNRRTAEIAQKQHQDSLKKIAKLESECQRLRLLVRKRLPGPAALTKMKNEVEMLGKAKVETRRRRSNPSLISSVDFHVDVAPDDTPSKRINFLTGQLLRMEEENTSLQFALNNKSNELQIPRNTYDHRTASSLSQGGRQVEGSFQGQTNIQPGKYTFLKQEHSLATLSDFGSDDKASCAESWASALVAEIEHFKNEKQLGTPSNRYMGISEMNLMDDFAEMEKLAVVSIDYPPASSHHSSDEGNTVIGPSGSPSAGHSSLTPGSETVPLHCSPAEPLTSGQEIQSENTAASKFPEQLSDLLKMLMEHCRALKRNPREVLEDMRVALGHNSSDTACFDGNGIKTHLDATYSPEVSGHVTKTSNKSLNSEISDTGNDNDISTTKKSDQKLQTNVSVPMCKILELLEGINLLPQDNGAAESLSRKGDKLLPYKSLATPTGYTARVFQWKTAELSAILQQFVQTCNDLLNGKADFEEFVRLVASGLDWVMNHCFSLQDVSSMKDAIRNHLNWDESRSESEVDSGSAIHSAESDQMNSQRETVSHIAVVSPLGGHNTSRHLEVLQEEAKKLIIEPAITKSSIIDLEGRVQSQIGKGESFRSQHQDYEDIVGNLQTEKDTGDQIEKWKMMEGDEENQLMEATLEQRKACQNTSHPNNNLEITNLESTSRQEGTCNGPKTQLKSKTSKEGQNDGKLSEKQLQNDWEISSASERLAECQETILNIGKQLKALASPRDAALFDKVISTPNNHAITSTPTPMKTVSKRLSLLDNMRAEDSDQIGASPGTADDIRNGNCDSTVSTNAAIESWSKFTDPNGIEREADTVAVVSMAIVPSKKNGKRSFLKKLLLWRKKGNRKKTPFS